MSHLTGCRCLDCIWNHQFRLAIEAWAIVWEVEGL